MENNTAVATPKTEKSGFRFSLNDTREMMKIAKLVRRKTRLKAIKKFLGDRTDITITQVRNRVAVLHRTKFGYRVKPAKKTFSENGHTSRFRYSPEQIAGLNRIAHLRTSNERFEALREFSQANDLNENYVRTKIWALRKALAKSVDANIKSIESGAVPQKRGPYKRRQVPIEIEEHDIPTEVFDFNGEEVKHSDMVTISRSHTGDLQLTVDFRAITITGNTATITL